MIIKMIKKEEKFYILSNPEFLAEGTAIKNLRDPDRVLIGGKSDSAISALKNIYLNWVEEKNISTDIWSSELSKLIANAFLAQRISSINSISALCEVTGANIDNVAKAVGMDLRIGKHFLNSGPGFGGSCFKKDILKPIYICNHYGLYEVAQYWEQVININNWQQKRISKVVAEKLFGNLSDKKISILGFSFKANTNDTRESPAINICSDLLEEGAYLSIYDPKVSHIQIEKAFDTLDFGIKNNWITSSSVYEAVEDADAILIITDWEEFYEIDYEKIFKIMRVPKWIFDTRNVVNKNNLENIGFKIWKLGSGEI